MKDKKSYLKLQYSVLGIGFLATYGFSMMLRALTNWGPFTDISGYLAIIAMIPGYLITTRMIMKNRTVAETAKIF